MTSIIFICMFLFVFLFFLLIFFLSYTFFIFIFQTEFLFLLYTFLYPFSIERLENLMLLAIRINRKRCISESKLLMEINAQWVSRLLVNHCLYSPFLKWFQRANVILIDLSNGYQNSLFIDLVSASTLMLVYVLV